MEEEKLTMSLYRIYKHIEDTIKEHGDISQFKEDVLYVINELLAKPIKVSTAVEIVVRNEERRINKMQREKDEEYIRKLKCEIDELEKERQADKEKIKEYAELLIKVNVQNLNNSIEQRKESNEQLEALHEGWKIELEKKDNRIKDLKEMNKIINKNWEDKIKAKIEKLDKEIKVKREIAKNPMDNVSGRLLTDSIVELEKAKSILQSLLKEEE